MIEKMFSEEGDVRIAYENGDIEYQSRLYHLNSEFDNQVTDYWRSISTPQYNPIYQDDVVSVVFSGIPSYLLDNFPMVKAAGRKYFLNKKWVYDKVYEFLPPDSFTIPVPDGIKAMFTGKLVNVFGQNGNDLLDRYLCVYFMTNKSHEYVENWVGRSLPQGEYSTFYSLTYDLLDENKIKRIKSYCYDNQGVFSDWDVIWLNECKSRNVKV